MKKKCDFQSLILSIVCQNLVELFIHFCDNFFWLKIILWSYVKLIFFLIEISSIVIFNILSLSIFKLFLFKNSIYLNTFFSLLNIL